MSWKGLLQLIEWLRYAMCLPFLVSEIYELRGKKDDSTFLIFLSVCILLFSNEVLLDLLNVTCVYSLFLTTSSYSGVLVAFSYSILHMRLRCFPRIFVNRNSCPICQYILALINILTVIMLFNQRQNQITIKT